MKFAVIGVYYASNLGDAVICECVAFWLREHWPQAQIDIIDIEGKEKFPVQEQASISLLQRRAYKVKWDYWLTRYGIRDRVLYWNQMDVDARQDFYDEIGERSYDAAVFAGGQLFMDWLTVDICEFIKYFEQAGTPVFFNACGAGFSVSEQIQRLTGNWLKSDCVKWLSSRDDAVTIQERYGLPDGMVERTFDPALWTCETFAFCREKEQKGKGITGLGIMYSTHVPLRQITAFWLRLIKELNRRKIPWRMFCNGAMEDYNYGCYVLKKAGLDPQTFLLPCPEQPMDLIRQIGTFDSLISFRLHSHIIAASMDIPAVAIVWDRKLRFFYASLKHPERCRTVKTSAADILQSLDLAQEEGYDQKRIMQQKKFARKLLISRIEDVLQKNRGDEKK